MFLGRTNPCYSVQGFAEVHYFCLIGIIFATAARWLALRAMPAGGGSAYGLPVTP